MASATGPQLPHVTIEPKRVAAEKMRAVAWEGKRTIKVIDMARPTVTDPADAIIRITSTAICGSDLHLYESAMPGMHKGDVLGHEFMGIVHEVGPNVRDIQVGDRVVAAFCIGCGTCEYCRRQEYSACEATNPTEAPESQSGISEMMYGHKTAGLYGYSHLTGGYQGGQAEYTRVPFADLNLLKVPQGMPDNQVLFLSDILPTAWHANELADVRRGDTVAIWGAGPVGVLAAHIAFQSRGARRVFVIDPEEVRRKQVKERVPGVEVIDGKGNNVYKQIMDLEPRGVDKSIDAVGFHYTKDLINMLEKTLKLETDPATVLNEAIRSTRKFGRIGVVAVYAGYTNHFNIGALMEKGLTMSCGQTPVQRYWKDLLHRIQIKELNPEIVITHELGLEEAAHGYNIFNKKSDNCLKVVMHPTPALASA